MVEAKESYLGSEDEDASINLLQDPHPHDDEAGETLSLCDLPIYSDESICDDRSKQNRSSSFDNEDGFFEFFSGDFSVSNSTYSGSDNIIFCGKLIPYKHPSAFEDAAKIKPEKSTSAKNFRNRTKSRSFNDGKPSAVNAEDREFASARARGVKSSKSISIPVMEDSEYIARKRSWILNKYDLPGERKTIMESSRTKSRWFLFLFGSGSFPKEMELSDMRTRQRRSSRSAMFRPAGEMEAVKGGSRRKGRGLWKLLGALVLGWRRDDKTTP